MLLFSLLEPGGGDRRPSQPFRNWLICEGFEGHPGRTCDDEPGTHLMCAVAGGLDLVVAVVSQPRPITTFHPAKEVAIEHFIHLPGFSHTNPMRQPTGAQDDDAFDNVLSLHSRLDHSAKVIAASHIRAGWVDSVQDDRHQQYAQPGIDVPESHTEVLVEAELAGLHRGIEILFQREPI